MNLSNFKQDLLASVVVFLVALPLCLGIAIASGVPPAAGLVTGIIGGVLVGALAGCPLQVSGPAAGLAVLVYEIVQSHGVGTLGIVVLLGGLLQIAAGFLKAGQIFRAISPAVIFGMLAGIGVLIFGAQFHVMVDDKPRADGLKNLMSIPESIYKGLVPAEGTSHHLAAYIGIATIVIILLWTRFAPKQLKWVPGALIAVGVATVAAWALKLPIRYVELSDNFLGSIKPLDLSSLASVLTPDILLLAMTVAFVASAETLLSAAAVDQMHDGPPRQLQSRADRAGRRQHDLRISQRAADDRSDRAQRDQRDRGRPHAPLGDAARRLAAGTGRGGAVAAADGSDCEPRRDPGLHRLQAGECAEHPPACCVTAARRW